MTLSFASLKDYSPEPQDEVFRWAVAPTVIPTLVFTSLFFFGAWQIVAPIHALEGIPMPVKILFTLGFLLFAWVAWTQTQGAIGQDSLIACISKDTLWVKFRSPLNQHIGSDADTQLVGIPLGDIVWSRPVTEKTLRKAAGSKASSRTVPCLDLGLSEDLDLDPLREMLQSEAERKKKFSHFHEHSPIRLLADHTVRLDLYNVNGGGQALQRDLPPSVEQRDIASDLIDLR